MVYHVFDEEALYFAFSKDTDDGLIARLNKALQDLKATKKGKMSRLEQMISACSVSMK